MSKEDIEVVRQVYDAAARGDASTVLSLYGPRGMVFATGEVAPDR
jgi:hypothetical protein